MKWRVYIDQKRRYYFFKRVFDICFCLLLTAGILSWLLPVIALLIKLDSRGPVFFAQKRVGKGGRTFRCYKFRTMIPNTAADEKQALENDPRITRIGRLLRKTNLDELPQLINVLMGNMSVVGPRPHMHADCRLFSRSVAGYKFRNMVKPGITGLAQVKGFHGVALTYESIFKRYLWDAFYIRNAGFLLDMKIIAYTFLQRVRYMLSVKNKPKPYSS